jgi:hypothetical protein
MPGSVGTSLRALKESRGTSQVAFFLPCGDCRYCRNGCETSHCILFHGVYVISQGAGKVTHENRPNLPNSDDMNPLCDKLL